MVLSREEERILTSIHVASENDPGRPEFPPENPKFPATPTYQINVPGFSNVWLKDESHNPTGTHKDRMAWEIIVTYRDFLLAKKRGQIKGPLPQMSIISSGSAAVAIQAMLNAYKLPKLKVLVDATVNGRVYESLKKLGCEIYKTDLSKRAFGWKDILTLTNNTEGFDITSLEALDPTVRFYDWMSYETINNNPDYIFLPFGTGNLYENLLKVIKHEVSTPEHDSRFKGNVKSLQECHVIGATTNDPSSKAAEKLYSPHLPFAHFDEQWIRLYKYAGYCGGQSGIHAIREKFLDEAINLAEAQGIRCEPSAIAGLALMLQMKDQLPKNKKILIVSTGKVRYP
jgi:hypothetical protein